MIVDSAFILRHHYLCEVLVLPILNTQVNCTENLNRGSISICCPKIPHDQEGINCLISILDNLEVSNNCLTEETKRNVSGRMVEDRILHV